MFQGRRSNSERNTEVLGQERPAERAPIGQERRAERAPRGALAASAAVDIWDLLARIVRLALLVVVAIIGLAILFVVLGASTSNGIVSTVRDWGQTLAGPFVGIFHLHHSPKGTVAIDYGLAIVVYAIVAELAIGLLRALLAPAMRHAPARHGSGQSYA